MKKFIRIFAATILILLAITAWSVLGPVVSSPDQKYLYIKTGSSYNDVKLQLSEQHVLNSFFYFDIICKQVGYTDHIRPGRYDIPNGSNIISLIRKLKSGNQEPVRLVINKLRTKEDLAGKIGRNFEADSAAAITFLTSNDSLSPYQLDTNTVMTVIVPNSYLIWWNGSFRKIFDRLKKQHDYFWEGERTAKAQKKGFTPEQIYTIASIVEEETNISSDKGKIASVYFNRLSKKMKLEADPTVKYAMRNFELKRILHGHLLYPSAYNTYYQTGLPPGPICTPSINTIDAVLDAPQTDFIFFVAKPDFSGYSNFAATYSEHLAYAKAYQAALDKLTNKKTNNP